MEVARFLAISFLLLSTSRQTNGSCQNTNSTWTHCHKWDDIDDLDTRTLKSLKVSIDREVFDPILLQDSSTLRHLDLSEGKLKRIESRNFHYLSNLESLNLAHNEIEYFDPNALEDSNHLRSLDLRFNNLRGIPIALKTLKKLRHLELQGNPLQCGCESLKIRDFLLKDGVKFSKKVICAGPGNSKGIQLLKPQSKIVCAFEEQDKGMLNDQPLAEGSGEGSGDYVEIKKFPEESIEVETPVPDIEEMSTSGLVIIPTSTTNTSDEDEFSFDPEENKSSKTSTVKDGLFYPPDIGSGEEEDSGEGSGTGGIYDNGETNQRPTTSTQSSGWNFLDFIFGTGETTTPRNDPNPDEEGFIAASSEKSSIVSTVSSSRPDVALETSSLASTSTPSSDILETSKTIGRETKTESVRLPSAVEPKKGMGSYIVLAILLAILLALIGFAAYKGDFCRKKKKRPRSDVENGTELKDMQKSLLESNNSTQPKITINGNTEILPLVNGVSEQDQSREAPKSSNGGTLIENSRSNVIPEKEPRQISDVPLDKLPESNSYSLDSLHSSKTRTNKQDEKCPSLNYDDGDAPPVSPGAQRVKIILQDNPDSVPKTPILITRTSTGDKLVKTP